MFLHSHNDDKLSDHIIFELGNTLTIKEVPKTIVCKTSDDMT